MLKQAMGYFGGVASSVASEVSLEGSVSDALVGSIVDVGGQKVVVRKRIGEGGFAFVYEVEETTDINKKYALKRLLAIDSEKRNYIIKEISFMKALSDHPNIVKFNAAAEAKGHYEPENLKNLDQKTREISISRKKFFINRD